MTSRSTASLWAAVVALVSASVASLLARRWQSSCGQLAGRVMELEAALEASVKQRAAERKGRIRAQQALRKFLVDKDTCDGSMSSFPMAPIGFIQSCFSTRNGTPRQPLLVPLARACLVLSPGGVPATALDGLTDYSHCWLLYIFHANTDLPHIWSQPTHKDFKAKVRVPRLDGGKMGVYATRTPHRPCPLGLTLAKVEGVHGRLLLISGADVVDGTPVLDVKPYLPYCDSVPDGRAPSWVNAGDEDDIIALASVDFSTNFWDELIASWEIMGKHSMYSSPQELAKLIEQVLARDIRSLRQRKNPQVSMPSPDDDDNLMEENDSAWSISIQTRLQGTKSLEERKPTLDHGGTKKDESHQNQTSVVYRLIIEGFTISYTVDDGHVFVHGAQVLGSRCSTLRDCNYSTWMKVTESRTC